MGDIYEEWLAKNGPRPDNDWERKWRETQEIDAAIEKVRKAKEANN